MEALSVVKSVGCHEVPRQAWLTIITGVMAVILLAIAFPGEREAPAIVEQRAVIDPRSYLLAPQAVSGLDTRAGDEMKVVEQLIRGLPTEGCAPPSPGPHDPSSNEELLVLMGSARERLSRSGDPDLLFAAALLNPDESERWQLVERALAVAPGNPVALWHQLHHCG